MLVEQFYEIITNWIGISTHGEGWMDQNLKQIYIFYQSHGTKEFRLQSYLQTEKNLKYLK